MTLTIKREQGKIFSHVPKKRLVERPKEGARQEYFGVLLNEYGYSIRGFTVVYVNWVVACDRQGTNNVNASFFCC